MISLPRIASLEGALWYELARELPHPAIPGLGELAAKYTTNLREASRLAKAVRMDKSDIKLAGESGSAEPLTTTNFTQYLASVFGVGERDLVGRTPLRIFFTTNFMPVSGVDISYQTLPPNGRGIITGTILRAQVIGKPANEITARDLSAKMAVDITGMSGVVEALRADADVACEANLAKYII